jgi:hypothetical protein
VEPPVVAHHRSTLMAARSSAVIRPHRLSARAANQSVPYRRRTASPPLRPHRCQSEAWSRRCFWAQVLIYDPET